MMRNTIKAIALIAILTPVLLVSIAAQKSERVLRHVVAFNYKAEITETQKQQVLAAFYALKKDIPQIIAFEGGDHIGKGGPKKFSQCFIVTVKNQEDLDTYGSHPKHRAFSAVVDPILAEVMVVDYWSEK